MVQALDCNHYANIMKVMKTISEYFKRLHIEFSSFSPFVFIENLIVISFFVGIFDRITSSNEDGLDLLILCCKWGCWVWLLLIWINRKLHTVVSVVREHLFPKRRTYLEVELNHLDIHASCCQVKFKLLLVSHVRRHHPESLSLTHKNAKVLHCLYFLTISWWAFLKFYLDKVTDIGYWIGIVGVTCGSFLF